MNVLLLYPEFPDTFWSFKHALKFIGKRASLPPLGLLTVAAMLPAEWEKRLVDVNVRPLREKDLAWADVVLISAMIAQRDSVEKLIARCRAAGKTIVAGGPLFTVEHAQFPDVDHFVLNEAETTLPEFLQDFAQGHARRVYTSTELPDLRATSAPLWKLVDPQHYASMSVQYSRGCPFDCDFCSVTAMFGHRPRVKTAAQILTELDGLWQRGWRGPVFFVDDNLIGNKRSLREELLPALIRWREGKRGFTFYTEASINLADDEELMKEMVDAGFNQVFVGIETPDEDCLAECSKRQNQQRDLMQDVKSIQRAGLQVQGGRDRVGQVGLHGGAGAGVENAGVERVPTELIAAVAIDHHNAGYPGRGELLGAVNDGRHAQAVVRGVAHPLGHHARRDFHFDFAGIGVRNRDAHHRARGFLIVEGEMLGGGAPVGRIIMLDQ